MSARAGGIRLRARALGRLKAEHLDPLDGFGDDQWRLDRPDEEFWLIEPEGAGSFLLRRFRWRSPNHAFDDERPVGSLMAKGRWLWSDGWASFDPALTAPNAFSALSERLPAPASEGWPARPEPWLLVELSGASAEFVDQWRELICFGDCEPDAVEQALWAAVEAALLREAVQAGASAQSVAAPRL